MKKILCLTLGMAAMGSAFAQKAKVREAGNELKKANEALNKKDEGSAIEPLTKAKTAIDAAILDPSTKDNSSAWFTKAAIYVTMQETQGLSAGKPYREGMQAMQKALELDKKTSSEEQFNSIMVNGAFYYFNDGVATMNNGNYAEGYGYFKQSGDFLYFDNGKLLKDNKAVDTMASKARLFQAYCAFYADRLDEAEGLLKAAAANPITASESNIYLILSQLYGKQKKTEQQLAIINDGKKKFPNDKNITAAELNYYIDNGKQEEMVAKLEEAAAADASNASLPYNLGIVYKNMAANPSVKDGAQYLSKAEASYQKAASLAPDNATYAYELGAFYYNQAVVYNNKMNEVTGTSSEEQRKYDGFKAQRDGMFAKALPYLEKSAGMYQANQASLSGQEMDFYKQGLDAMVKIYAMQDQIDKMNAAKEKLNALN